jgi:hypothetical protein
LRPWVCAAPCAHLHAAAPCPNNCIIIAAKYCNASCNQCASNNCIIPSGPPDAYLPNNLGADIGCNTPLYSHVYKVPAKSPREIIHVAGTTDKSWLDYDLPYGRAVDIYARGTGAVPPVAMATAPSQPGAFYWATRNRIWSVGLVQGRAAVACALRAEFSTCWRFSMHRCND